MEVRGPGHISGAAPVGRTTAAAPAQPTPPTGALAPRDEVEISSAGRLLDAASRAPGVREQRLEQIKAAIAAGNYETPEKLEMAVARMLQQMASDAAADG